MFSAFKQASTETKQTPDSAHLDDEAFEKKMVGMLENFAKGQEMDELNDDGTPPTEEELKETEKMM